MSRRPGVPETRDRRVDPRRTGRMSHRPDAPETRDRRMDPCRRERLRLLTPVVDVLVSFTLLL